MRLAISLVTSLVTLATMWAAGSKKVWAWPLGLTNQVFWVVFIVAFGAWGLLPLTFSLIIIYSRNWWLWTREQEA